SFRSQPSPHPPHTLFPYTTLFRSPESLGYIKRLVRSAIDTPHAEGLALERNLFMRLCVSDQALARMRSYEAKEITDPSRSLEARSEEHTSELQSRGHLVCRLLLEK